MEEQPEQGADVVDGGGTDEEASVSNGCEPLAGFLLAIVWAMVLHGYLTALALARSTAEAEPPLSFLDLVEYGAAGSFSLNSWPLTFVVAPIVLVIAYVLVAIMGPGDLIGRSGVHVLQGIRITGLVVTLNAVISLVAMARRGDRFSVFSSFGPDQVTRSDALVTFLDRLALCLPLLAGAAAVVYVTWLANRLLTEDAEPESAEAPTPRLG